LQSGCQSLNKKGKRRLEACVKLLEWCAVFAGIKRKEISEL
jgi:hypothetical protein